MDSSPTSSKNVNVNPFLIDLVLDLILDSDLPVEDLKNFRSVNSQWDSKCISLLTKKPLSPISLFEITSTRALKPYEETWNLSILMNKFSRFPNPQLFRSFLLTGNQLQSLANTKFLAQFHPKHLKICCLDRWSEYCMSLRTLHLLTTCSESLESLHLNFGPIHPGFSPEPYFPPHDPKFPNLQSLTLTIDPESSDSLASILLYLFKNPMPKLRSLIFPKDVPNSRMFIGPDPFFQAKRKEPYWDNLRELVLNEIEFEEYVTLVVIHERLNLTKLHITRILYNGSLNIEFGVQTASRFGQAFAMIVGSQRTVEDLALGFNLVLNLQPGQNPGQSSLRNFLKLRKLYFGVSAYYRQLGGTTHVWEFFKPFDFNATFPQLETFIFDSDFRILQNSIRLTQNHPLRNLIWKKLTPIPWAELHLAFPHIKTLACDIYVLRDAKVCWKGLVELVIWNKSEALTFVRVLEILERLLEELKELRMIKFVEVNSEARKRMAETLGKLDIIFSNQMD